MDIICIQKFITGITCGKIYTVIENTGYDESILENNYSLLDNMGYQCLYKKSYFKPLHEIRDEKINEILE